MPDMKVEKNQDSPIFLATFWILIVKIWQFFFFNSFLKFGEFGPFFSWKVLCIDWNHIFQVEFLQKFANKKNTGKHPKKGREKETRGKDQSPLKQAAQTRRVTRKKGDHQTEPSTSVLQKDY